MLYLCLCLFDGFCNTCPESYREVCLCTSLTSTGSCRDTCLLTSLSSGSCYDACLWTSLYLTGSCRETFLYMSIFNTMLLDCISILLFSALVLLCKLSSAALLDAFLFPLVPQAASKSIPSWFNAYIYLTIALSGFYNCHVYFLSIHSSVIICAYPLHDGFIFICLFICTSHRI